MLYKVSDLFDLTHTRAAELLEKCEYPHEVLPRIKPFILALGETLPISEFEPMLRRLMAQPRNSVYKAALKTPPTA